MIAIVRVMGVQSGQDPVDILVIGGGINGVGIARDASGCGYSVMLCERDDLASHTSSASTKLIHGGLRYLEQYEFKLVKESLCEREVLLKAAPHIIWPMRFILPHHKGLRPAWVLRLGLFLYDHLGGRKILPPTKKIALSAGSVHGEKLSDAYSLGFEYSDCWVEDSRLVALTARDAFERGAQIRTQTVCHALERQGDLWRVLVQTRDGSKEWILARSVVNAAGPWVDDILKRQSGSGSNDPKHNQQNLRLVKGSHIITKRLFDGDEAFIFQHSDGRIVFAIPYEQDFTLIGTTDLAFQGDAASVEIDDSEIDYLCELINGYLKKPISKADIVSTYSGVRPLFDDHEDNASVVTRDYVFDISEQNLGAPILSIFGGKITTYRKMAEHAVARLRERLPLTAANKPPSGPWTKDAPLPGGDIPNADFDSFLAKKKAQFPGFSDRLLRRLARAYGTRMEQILKGHQTPDDLGMQFGGGLSQAEVCYLVQQEFVTHADDILWRRSKLGLHMSPSEINEFTSWFNETFSINVTTNHASSTRF